MNEDSSHGAKHAAAEPSLLVDVGNSRIKWAVLSSTGLGPQHADSYHGWSEVQLRARVLIPAGPVGRVLVASVAAAPFNDLIRRAVGACGELEPEFLQSAAAGGGVRNAYRNPAQLGVDRWAALIGARSLERRACCIVDVGTAATIDGLDADGRHLGGLIVPGPDLMITSLMRRTSEIAQRADSGHFDDSFFADNTLGAVYQGAVQALAALIERATTAIRSRTGAAPALILTGGAADRVRKLLDAELRWVPDLVLRGLAVLAGDSDGTA